MGMNLAERRPAPIDRITVALAVMNDEVSRLDDCVRKVEGEPVIEIAVPVCRASLTYLPLYVISIV